MPPASLAHAVLRNFGGRYDVRVNPPSALICSGAQTSFRLVVSLSARFVDTYHRHTYRLTHLLALLQWVLLLNGRESAHAGVKGGFSTHVAVVHHWVLLTGSLLPLLVCDDPGDSFVIPVTHRSLCAPDRPPDETRAVLELFFTELLQSDAPPPEELPGVDDLIRQNLSETQVQFEMHKGCRYRWRPRPVHGLEVVDYTILMS